MISGSRPNVRLRSGEPLTMILPCDTEIRLRAELPRFVFAPVRSGETAGRILVIIDNKIVAQSELVYAQDAALAYPI